MQKALRSPSGTRIALFAILVIALSGSAIFNLTKYFVFFAASPTAAGSFNENYTNMSRYLLSLPDEIHKYVLVDEKGNNDRFRMPVFAHPTYFLTYGRVQSLEIVESDTVLRRPGIFLMLNYNATLAERIRTFYPDTHVERIDLNGKDRAGGDFDVIILPLAENNGY